MVEVAIKGNGETQELSRCSQGRGRRGGRKDKKRIIFARILREAMRKNKVRWRNAPLEKYEQVYEKFWSEKKKVTEEDVEYMKERVNELG